MVLNHFPAEKTSLNNCDREPIHVPGSIQPHGVLFVLTEPGFMIEQVSENIVHFIDISPENLLGQPLTHLLDAEQISMLDDCLKRDFESMNPLQISIQRQEEWVCFNGILHRSPQNKLILELEPIGLSKKSEFSDFYRMTRSVLAQIQRTKTLSELCQVMVQQVRYITQFDRVMVYRFDADGSGTVIAEDKLESLEPYLGLHYPSSDIPRQAKELYRLNPLRLIPDVSYKPVAIAFQKDTQRDTQNNTPKKILENTLRDTPEDKPEKTQEDISASQVANSLDLTFSVLRSVSPIHIEYLHNMGVGASMSISLLKNGQLWGLIACHHQTSRFIPYDVRLICEFLGQVMSLDLTTREQNEDLDYKVHLKSIQTQLIDSLTSAQDLVTALLHQPSHLLQLVGAEGAAIWAGGELVRVGQTPAEPELKALLVWLEDKFENHLFVTDSLPQLYAPAQHYKEVASGLLALSITRVQRNDVLWFRREILQQVNWAGNPDKPKRVEADGSLTIFPRKSFEQWQETVRLKSLPWQPWEIEGAIELRSAIVGIILRKADELAAMNLELERINFELDSFAYIASHDLKEPLRGIHNYSTFLLEDYATVLPEDGLEKLETVVRLTKRMEALIDALLHFSRLGRQALNLRSINLNELVHQVVDVLHVSMKSTEFVVHIPETLPAIRGDQILIEEVFINLLSNALKYSDRPQKRIEVGFDTDLVTHDHTGQSYWVLYVRDNGIGIREKHWDTVFRIFKRLHVAGKYGGGTGAGLTIVKKIIERHGGKIWVESTYGEGSTFYFTLPA